MLDLDHIAFGTNGNARDGFVCCWCGDWHPWSAVELFDGPRRWCPTCGDAFERIVDPPVYYAGGRR